MGDEFRTDGDPIVPGDVCACGERAEAHITFNDVGEIEREPWWCDGYRRSPLSAFRGPSVRFTREEAAGWLDGLFMASVAAAIRRGESPKAWARQLVQLASYDRRRGIYPRRVALDYLAARILRAVRP